MVVTNAEIIYFFMHIYSSRDKFSPSGFASSSHEITQLDTFGCPTEFHLYARPRCQPRYPAEAYSLLPYETKGMYKIPEIKLKKWKWLWRDKINVIHVEKSMMITTVLNARKLTWLLSSWRYLEVKHFYSDTQGRSKPTLLPMIGNLKTGCFWSNYFHFLFFLLKLFWYFFNKRHILFESLSANIELKHKIKSFYTF